MIDDRLSLISGCEVYTVAYPMTHLRCATSAERRLRRKMIMAGTEASGWRGAASECCYGRRPGSEVRFPFSPRRRVLRNLSQVRTSR